MVCVCVCVLGTRVNCAKTAELIEMPFRRLARGSKDWNHVLDKVKVRRIHPPPQWVTRRRFGLFAKVFLILLDVTASEMRSVYVCKRSLGWINYDNYVHITQPKRKIYT